MKRRVASMCTCVVLTPVKVLIGMTHGGSKNEATAF